MTLFLLTVHQLEVIIFMRSILVSKNKNNNSDILKFLAEAKNLVIEKKFIFVPRKKNLQSLASCGLTIVGAKYETILKCLSFHADEFN